MENYEKEFVNLLENLRSELDKERQETLNIVSIVHFYESMMLSLNMQVATENLNSKHGRKAIAFAEKVSKTKLDILYSNQNSISGLDKDLFNVSNPLNKSGNDPKLH